MNQAVPHLINASHLRLTIDRAEVVHAVGSDAESAENMRLRAHSAHEEALVLALGRNGNVAAVHGYRVGLERSLIRLYEERLRLGATPLPHTELLVERAARLGRRHRVD